MHSKSIVVKHSQGGSGLGQKKRKRPEKAKTASPAPRSESARTIAAPRHRSQATAASQVRPTRRPIAGARHRGRRTSGPAPSRRVFRGRGPRFRWAAAEADGGAPVESAERAMTSGTITTAASSARPNDLYSSTLKSKIQAMSGNDGQVAQASVAANESRRRPPRWRGKTRAPPAAAIRFADKRSTQAKNVVSSPPRSGRGTQSGSSVRACSRFCSARWWLGSSDKARR